MATPSPRSAPSWPISSALGSQRASSAPTATSTSGSSPRECPVGKGLSLSTFLPPSFAPLSCA
eukprot:4406593-Pyramimonas_sp.AAC.1